MLSATDFDERVTVLGESVSKNEYGEETVSYTEERTIWADVQVRSGSERRVSGQPEERAAILVRTRKEAVQGVGRDGRLRYNGDDLQVHARREVGTRDRFIELETTRVR